ncbi:MAG TPA: HAMP domain-containing sensor histidine kinase [Candidatus Angelobacter sp.]|jgi:signal transduction histidine kinase|nr:HAMP domain-containing sensor histidine kinase [Candidatus Angelobacter sp.]
MTRLQRQQPSENVNALAELGLFSAGIMHEIKNALQGIANALFLLGGEQSLSPRVRQEVEIARRELSRALDVSAQTLALAREENPVAMSIVEVLEEVLSRYSAKTAYKHFTIDRQYEFSGSIQGLPGAIRQVFSNIVLNALESGPLENGKLVIHTFARRSSNNGKTPGVQIDFADNGPGIPDQYKKKVFQPLFSTKKGKGSGLGLWVARRLVLKQHGQISLVSRSEGLNSGTCFSVFLPLTQN